MLHGSPADRALIEAAIRDGGLDKLEDIIAAVRRCGALDYTRQVAEHRIERALAGLHSLPESPYKQGLRQVADAALRRNS